MNSEANKKLLEDIRALKFGHTFADINTRAHESTTSVFTV